MKIKVNLNAALDFRWAPDVTLTSIIGKPVTKNDKVIGRIIDYEVVPMNQGDLIVEIEITDQATIQEILKDIRG